jgi:hypothetical protein
LITSNILKYRIRSVWYWFKTKVLQLNIFTKKLIVDVHYHYVGIIATRIYFLLIILSTTIIIIYTSVKMHIQYTIISELSLEKFEHLQSNSRYVSTLEYPCRHISIPYGQFISVAPEFHQLYVQAI